MKKKWYNLTPDEITEIKRRHEERMRWWLIAIGPFMPVFGMWVVWFLQARGYEPFRNNAHTLIGSTYQAGWLTFILHLIITRMNA